jgi:hypothetical protein
MIESLADNLTVGSVEIDLISVKGPAFGEVNNTLAQSLFDHERLFCGGYF